MTALIPRLRRQARLAREEYALPAATASGPVRGRPTGPRTLTFSSTAMNRGLPAACPGVSTNASGRRRRPAARWTLLVSPPHERPSAAASSRARRRRRSRRRSARSDSPAGEPPATGAICPVSVAPFPRRGPFQHRQDLRFHHHPGRVVMGAGHCGVHADQRHVRLAAPSSLGDHPLHQRGEHADVAPLGEAVVDRLPGPELPGHLPPLATGTEPPDDALKLFAQVLWEGAVPSDRQERLYQFPLIIAQFTSRHLSVLPARRDARVRIRPY